MLTDSATVKPKAVLQAEWVLWAWTAWLCGYGLFQTYYPDAASQDLLAQLQSVVALAPDQFRTFMIATYAVVGVSMVLLVFQIGAGRRWARGSLLLSFVVQVLYVAQAGPSEYLANAPDLIFQAAALRLLYTDPGRQLFKLKGSRTR